jgi:hypothetical protein
MRRRRRNAIHFQPREDGAINGLDIAADALFFAGNCRCRARPSQRWRDLHAQFNARLDLTWLGYCVGMGMHGKPEDRMTELGEL